MKQISPHTSSNGLFPGKSFAVRIFTVLPVIFFLLVIPHSVFAEEITTFAATASVEKNGSVRIRETIDYDFGRDPHHGIFRKIPVIKTNTDGKRFILEFADIDVVDRNNSRYRFITTNQNGFLEIKIGDPDKTITGRHTYIISYTVAGGLAYFSDHVEFYWNSTGTTWEVPIEKASITVKLPEEIAHKDTTTVCYTGPGGSKEKNCTALVAQDILVYANRTLAPSEGLTVDVGFPRGVVAVLEPAEYVPFAETPSGHLVSDLLVAVFLAGGLLWYIVTPVVLMIRFLRFGRDPKPPVGVASAWFEAPKTKAGRTLSPGETGTLIDEAADLRDIFATIVDLARRGYMRIIENKKDDYTFMKLPKTGLGDTLLPHENLLFNALFKNGDQLRLSDAALESEIEDVKNTLYESLVKDEFFPENPKKIRDVYTVIGAIALTTANLPVFIICMTFGMAMPRKTLLGASEAAVASSLKNFLVSQETKLTYQAKNYMFFEKLLPYAIAFGVEKIWAARFGDIAMKEPDWYVGSGPAANFTSASFVHSLGSSFSKISYTATPTMSTRGFSSGFGGGGGFSGGGGGGGGGGSW